MSPGHFMRLVKAELRAVFGRWSGRGALILAVLVPIAASLAMSRAMDAAGEATLNGMPASTFIDMSWRGVLNWGLQGRNFFVLPLLLVLATASAVAGELGDNTMREALLRPVPRAAVLLAKLAALGALSFGTLTLTLLIGMIGGAAVAGTDAEIGKLVLGYGASFASDLGLIAMTLLVSVFLRSVGGVVVVVILYLIVDKAVGLGLKGLGAFGVEWAREAGSYLPGNALAVWEGWNAATGFDPKQWAGLALLFAIGLGGSLARFHRMDVP